MDEIRPDKQLLVADAMATTPWVMSPDTKLADACTLLQQKQLENFVVTDKMGHVCGALELRDVVLAQVDDKKRKTVGELLPAEVLIVSALGHLSAVVAEMKKRKINVVAVVDSQTLKGCLSLSGVGLKIADLIRQKDQIIDDLRAEIERKDEYLGLVTHDMRAPLTVISLSTDYLLMEECAKSFSQDQKSFVERIKRNGEIAAAMIHDILDVVRLDKGFQMDYQKVLFSPFLRDCAQNLSVIAVKKNVTINVIDDQDIQINLDPRRIRQVIENLVINAIKFSPNGGQVYLQASLVERKGAPFLALQVRDQGIGIPKEQESKIFEAFVQSDRHVRADQGVGLGLAIVRKFVEFHQGMIEVDGGWQKGACITVLLPDASPVAAEVKADAAPKGPVILLVEDDESIREFYKHSLDQHHFQVIVAGDGSEAFALFQRNHIDLVLSDIRMPKMDGLELLARIRMTGSRVPVILCSGYYVGLENDLSRSPHKPDRIIDKPFKVKDMVEYIEDLLEQNQKAS